MSGFITKELLQEAINKTRRKRRTQTELLEDGFNNLLNISTNLYQSKPKDRFFKNLMENMPITPIKKRNKTNSEANKQIGIARSDIKRNSPIIQFDISKINESSTDYFFKELANVIHELLDSIELDTDKWVIYYNYGDSWKAKPLDTVYERLLINQIENELEDANYEYEFDEHDYDFFPYGIRKLKQLTLINQTMIKNFRKLNHLIVSNANRATIEKYMNRGFLKNKGRVKAKREGRFWKWYLSYKEIDLSRFMIFNKLGKEEVNIIERDNCFIYACAMAGLDCHILDDLRYNIHKRSIATSDITKAANECDLKIRVKLANGEHYFIGNGTHEISLLLMNNHYMVNERVKVSPYYIKHREEINNDRNSRFWKIEDRMRIYRKNSKGYYDKGTTFSLRKVLLALFDVGAFVPISAGEYMTFNSLICFEKIDPIKDLSYDSKFCCRLKESFII